MFSSEPLELGKLVRNNAMATILPTSLEEIYARESERILRENLIRQELQRVYDSRTTETVTSPPPRKKILQMPADAKALGNFMNAKTGEIIRPWSWDQVNALGSDWKQTSPTYMQLVEAFGTIPGSGGKIDYDRQYNKDKTGYALSAVEDSIVKDIKRDIQERRSLTGVKIAELADKYDNRVLSKTLRESGYDVSTSEITKTQNIVKYGSLERAIASDVDSNILRLFPKEEVSKASDFVSSLNEPQRQILKDKGLQELQTQVDQAIKTLEKTPGVKSGDDYDIPIAIDANVDKKTIDLVFGEGTYDQQKEVSDARKNIAQYGDPVQAAIEGKIDKRTWEQAGLTLEGFKGSPSEAYKTIEKIRPVVEKYDGDLALAIQEGVKPSDLAAVYGKPKVNTATAFAASHVLDPKTDQWYPRDWYHKSQKDTPSTADVVMQLTGTDKQKSASTIQGIFNQKGIEGVDAYIQDLITQREKTLQPYAMEFVGPLKPGEERPVSYDINRMAEDRIKAGKTESQVINEMTRLGFDGKIAATAIGYAKADAKGRFDILQEQGAIPKEAVYAGDENGQPSYFVPDKNIKTIEAEFWNDKGPAYKHSPSWFEGYHRSVAVRRAYDNAAGNKQTEMAAELKTLMNSRGPDRDRITPENFKKLSLPTQHLLLAEYQNWIEEKHLGPERAVKTLALMTPGLGTYVTYKDRGLTSGWTIASAFGDALFLIGAVGGAATGARAYGLPSRVGRMKAAAAGAYQGTFGLPRNVDEAVQSLKQPVIKAIDRVRPDFIPLSAMEKSSGTVRIPIGVAGSAEDAIKIRNLLMDKVIAGEKAVITYKGVTYKLNKALVSGPSHATPSSSFLKEGSKVAKKSGMPDSEQGLFIGSGLHSRFVPASAFGKTGQTPGVGIFGRTAQQQAVDTGKIFRGTAELEKKLPIGTDIQPMTKQGISRTATGVKFEVLAEENIPRLKKIAGRVSEPVVSIKDTFTPAISVKGAKVRNIDLLAEANRYDEAAAAAEKVGDTSKAALLRAEAWSLREERLARPLTAGASRTLATAFARYGSAFEKRARQEKDITDAASLYRISDRFDTAASYLRRLSINRELRNAYNRYLSLDAREKAKASRLLRTISEGFKGIGRDTPRKAATPTTAAYLPLSLERPDIERATRAARVTTPRVEISTRQAISRSRADAVRTVPTKVTTPKPSTQVPYAEIESVKGAPEDPGEVLWQQGELNDDPVWIEAKPPSPDDIEKGKRGEVEILRKAPADAPKKEGTPKETLFKRGQAPEEMIVKVGAFKATVKRGHKISFDRAPKYLTRSGKGVLVGREKPIMRKRRK